MSRFINPLDHVKIAAPCPAEWDQMFSFENERVRFCSQCNMNVYNLSGMTRSEAEALLTYTEGRLCVRFYRRSDGTILTKNCPIGLKAIKRRVAWVAQALLGMVLSLLSGLGLYSVNVLRKQINLFNPQEVHIGVLVRPAEKQVGLEPALRVKTGKREFEAINQHGAVPAETVREESSDRASTNKFDEAFRK